MKITALGAGSMPMRRLFNPTSFLLELDGKKILLDCGYGAVRRLVSFGYSPADIDLIFISHFHPDHAGDAFNLIVDRFTNDKKNHLPHKDLIFLGPSNSAINFEKWREIFWREPDEGYPVIWRSQNMKMGAIETELFEVKHSDYLQSLAIVIKYDGKKIVYTGDLSQDNDQAYLSECFKNADLLIAEVSCKNVKQHYPLNLTVSLKEKSKAKKVLGYHLGHLENENIKKILAYQDFFILVDGESVEI